MKIALIGSAPSSVRLAPYQDPSWQIWACSPGTYSVLPRCDEFFELHRWEPGVIGKADTQVPWFSPEYVAWIKQQPVVWVAMPVQEIPNHRVLPWEALIAKYGSYFFTSSLSWMMAMAIERILEAGKPEGSSIGLWGVDMAANEEYAEQRPGCQFFITLAAQMGIEIHLPDESDLMAPPVLYGICEHTKMFVKTRERRKELTNRLNAAQANFANITREIAFLQGALDDLEYFFKTWSTGGAPYATDFKSLFAQPADDDATGD